MSLLHSKANRNLNSKLMKDKLKLSINYYVGFQNVIESC